MKRVIIIILFFILLIGGFLCHTIFIERQDQEEMITNIEIAYMEEWIERLDLLYSDETYKQLGGFFETVQDELEHFVSYLLEYNLFEELTQVVIEFPLTEHEAMLKRDGNVREWHRLIIYNDEIVTETSAERLIELFENHYELLNIITDMNENDTLSRVSISDTGGRGVQIRFSINTDHTEFTERLVPGTLNTFYYIEGCVSDIELERKRRIVENWYMGIRQPFKLGDRPIPLED